MTKIRSATSRLKAANFLGVVERRGGVVDRAWSDDDQQPIVFTTNNGPRLFAAAQHRFHLRTADRKLFLDLRRSNEPGNSAHAEILQRQRGNRSAVAPQLLVGS